MTRAWLLIDADKIDRAVSARLGDRRDAFYHPPLGCFAVPVDVALVGHGIAQLVAEGVPEDAITVGGR